MFEEKVLNNRRHGLSRLLGGAKSGAGRGAVRPFSTSAGTNSGWN